MNKESIVELLFETICEVSDYAKNELDSLQLDQTAKLHFIDLGVNSIDYAEVATIINAKVGIEIPLDIYAKTNSIGEVADLIQNSLLGRTASSAFVM